MRAIGLALVAASMASSAEAGRVLYAGPHWAALERAPGRCEAVGQAERVATSLDGQARIAFAFAADGRRRGELHVRLPRPARPGAQALLTVNGESFLLLTRGRDAWSRGPTQETAIIAALRRATDMRVRAQGVGGRVSDRYLLAGAPTAIDAAAAACAPTR